jgi:TatD DNase family protein
MLALDILNELQFKGKAVFHFFKGKYSDFEEILKNHNYFFGFSGIVTYDDTMDKIIQEVPLERLLIETDAPYVAPIPFRGELNQPKYVIKVAEKISRLKGMSIEDVLDITYNNTIDFFNI